MDIEGGVNGDVDVEVSGNVRVGVGVLNCVDVDVYKNAFHFSNLLPVLLLMCM